MRAFRYSTARTLLFSGRLRLNSTHTTAPGYPCAGAPSSERESKPRLQGSPVLPTCGLAETRSVRFQTRAKQVAAGVERKIHDCGIGRARNLQGRVPRGDVGLVERVESIEPERKPPALAQTELALQGKIEILVEATAHVVDAGLEADAPHLRRGKGGGVELLVDVAAASRAGRALNGDAPAEVRRTGDVLIAGAVLEGYTDRGRAGIPGALAASAGSIRSPNTGELPISGHGVEHLLGGPRADVLQSRYRIHDIALERVPGGNVVLKQRIGLGLVGAVGPGAVGVVLDTGPGIGHAVEQDRVVDIELQAVAKAATQRNLQSVRGDEAAGKHHVDTAVAAVSAHHVLGQGRSARKRAGDRRVLVTRQKRAAHIDGVDVDLFDVVVAVQASVGDIEHSVLGQHILHTEIGRAS